MIPSSSNNRTPGQCDAILSVKDPQFQEVTGPLRLPLEEPESFVKQFNRIYARIGLSIHSVPATDFLPQKKPLQNLVIQRTSVTSQITTESLRQKKCVPCEGGVPVIEGQAASEYLPSIPLWSINDTGKMISRKFNAGSFVKAMQILQQIAELAEAEQHHPDLHLTGYRHVQIDLTTHAIGGLSENDFVVAAKIDTLLSD